MWGAWLSPLSSCGFKSPPHGNEVICLYALLGIRSCRLSLRLVEFSDGPRLAGVILLGMPEAKSGIAGEAGGMYTAKNVELRRAI